MFEYSLCRSKLIYEYKLQLPVNPWSMKMINIKANTTKYDFFK